MESKRKMPLILLIALLITATVVSATVMVVVLSRDKTAKVIAPDYAVPEAEKNASEIENADAEDKMPVSEGGGAVSLTYSDQMTLSLSEKKITLLFANPLKSVNDVLLQITVKDNLIAQSGMIKPGFEVNELSTEKGAENMLTTGIYEGIMTAFFYDPESGEKAMVNTSIPVKITVTD